MFRRLRWTGSVAKMGQCIMSKKVDLGVSCMHLDPRIAVSNPIEVDGFLYEVKFLNTIPLLGT